MADVQVQDGDDATKKDSTTFDNMEIKRAAMTQPGLDQIFQGTCDAQKKVMPYGRIGFSLYAPENAAFNLTVADGPSAGSFYQVGLMFDSQMSHHGWVFQHQNNSSGEICNDSLAYCIIGL